MKLATYKKYSIGCVLLCVVVFCVIFSSTVFAQEVASTTSSTVSTRNVSSDTNSTLAGVMGVSIPVVGLVAKGILWLVNMIIAGILSVVGVITGLILEFNMTILDFSPPFVATGWTIFRDIANLGFVFGIIVIAIATILRYKGYTAKEILIKLIIAALVVNFSLVIAGAFIELSNGISGYLLSAITGQAVGNLSSSVIAKIGDSFGFVDIVNDTASWSVGDMFSLIGLGSGANLSVLLSLAVLVIFGIIFLFTLLGFAGMLFLRYFYLSFLLIVSPIVWLLWIFPSTSRYFKQWWTSFFKWVQFTPVVLVFVYIALTMMKNYASYKDAIEASGANLSGFGGGDDQLKLGSLMTGLIACALLIGGLKMATSMSNTGASMAVNMWDKGSKKTKTWAQSRAKWLGSRAGTKAFGTESSLGKRIQGGLVKIGSGKGYKTNVGAALGKTANILTLGALGKAGAEAAQGFAVGQVKMEKGSQKLAGEYEKNLKDLSPKQLVQLLPTLNKNEQTAALKILASKDSVSDLKVVTDKANQKIVLEAMNNLEAIGLGKEKGVLEKKLGMNEDMLRAWSAGGANGSFEKVKKDKDGNIEKDENGNEKKEIIVFSEAAEKFFKAFSKEDHKSFAKNMQGYFDGKGGVAPIAKEGNENIKMFMKPYITNIINTDLGTGMSSFSSALKTEEQRKQFYTELIRGMSESIKGVDLKRAEELEEILAKAEKSPSRKMEQDNFDAVIRVLKKSDYPQAKKLANKMEKSISAQMYEGDEGDVSGEKDKEKEKKDENKDQGNKSGTGTTPKV